MNTIAPTPFPDLLVVYSLSQKQIHDQITHFLRFIFFIGSEVPLSLENLTNSVLPLNSLILLNEQTINVF